MNARDAASHIGSIMKYDGDTIRELLHVVEEFRKATDLPADTPLADILALATAMAETGE